MNTYARQNIAFARGEGVWLWDTNGNKYLDAVSGVAVCGLGHAHPAVADALCAQARTLVHTSNLYQIPNQIELGEQLTRLSGMDKVFFGNSGAEANEAAIKLARLYGRKKNIDNPLIIVAENSFHGRTLATLSATGNKKIQAGFEPLVAGFIRVPYDDLDAIARVAENTSDVVAILMELVQGEGGVRIPDPAYLAGLRQLCDDNGWLLMLDEIQTGTCRTGKWFAYQHTAILPDVVTLAKGLGNGVPIGCCLARGVAAQLFQPGNHGSTFGGNPLAAAAALAVLTTLREQNLAQRAEELGRRIKQSLSSALEGVSGVTSVRGLGLMIGIELDRPCAALVPAALAQGLLINVTADRVVRLLPPLIMTDTEADLMTGQLANLIISFTQT